MLRMVWNDFDLALGETCFKIDGREIVVPKMERKLFYFLLRHPDTPLSREVLLKEVWDYGMPGATRTVDTHVKNLRAHLGRAGENIITVRGVGYRLAGEPRLLKCG